ncbi:hypothetical protein BSR28_06510 [Boudabousia liubingyangii]|uniref:type 1 glutamine amidotransferase n=1 Tax=Boudabousia liubingyangii TaxID=1921764 RepID=UPI00093E2C4C|nr:type 1 glutamine amidotransferase [Boudabousia liubingyangii]OKL47057.1 hypothetical protein BSR28_06510 [Boudabousia liubingyangii]
MITVLQPDLVASPGRFPRWARHLGIELNMIPLFSDRDIPAPIPHGEALIVLGGRMNAHSEREHSWLNPLRDLMVDCVERQVPVLAICLGAQIAARTFGGRVATPAPGQDEVGLVPWTANEAASSDPLLGPALRAAREAGAGGTFPAQASHHDAVVELPEGATLLASSAVCPIHTWRYGSLVAFQHHPEMAAPRLADLVARESIRFGASAAEAKSLWFEAVSEAAEIEPITDAFGQTLLGTLESLAASS